MYLSYMINYIQNLVMWILKNKSHILLLSFSFAA
jgi:hypothetical protein